MTTETDAGVAVDRPAAMFVADHPALDFLNSEATPAGRRIDWLTDGPDLLAWLAAAGLIDATVATLLGTAEPSALDATAAQARVLRAWLRDVVERHAGRELGPAIVAELGPLNELLARTDGYDQIAPGTDGRVVRWQRVRRWTAPDQLLQPIAEAIGDLLCTADFRLIRACEGAACTLMFLDKTKAHSRRWCSMAVCGNRAKAAAHRARGGARRA